ncbi:MAG: peptidylprolyl isomerase [Rickettsiales bacterium]|nr:MAG: peptidylprolyl isomerase [Rickettsiales bacterium]
MQKLLTLIITAVILYMIFEQRLDNASTSHIIPAQENINTSQGQGIGQTHGEGQSKGRSPNQASGTFLENTLSNVVSNVLKTDEGRIFMKSMFQPMNNGSFGDGFEMNNNVFLNSMFKIMSFDEGVGMPVSCGHIVTVHYKILNMKNITLEERTATFPLGSEEIAPGLDAVIVGMRTGQTRHATISNKYIPGTEQDKESSFKINVLLQEIMPKHFVGEDVKIFDSKLAYKRPLVCGNKTIYDARVTKLSNGEVLYDSKKRGEKINMRIGNIVYPVIFSHALHNKIPVGTRSVIAKGHLFKSYASNFSTIFPDKELPKDEYFMVEFFNFE